MAYQDWKILGCDKITQIYIFNTLVHITRFRDTFVLSIYINMFYTQYKVFYLFP